MEEDNLYFQTKKCPDSTVHMLTTNLRNLSWCGLVHSGFLLGQRQSIKIGNRSSESVAKFKYLRTTLTDQNSIHEEIKSRLNSGNDGRMEEVAQ
jgi:hypothetical protein